jgi:hypothetical protein
MTTRRQFMERAGAVTAAVIAGRACSPARAAPFETPLPVPKLRDARANNGSIDLTAAKSRHAFGSTLSAATYGFSAPVLGPVPMPHRGDEVQVAVENKMAHPFTATFSNMRTRG